MPHSKQPSHSYHALMSLSWQVAYPFLTKVWQQGTEELGDAGSWRCEMLQHLLCKHRRRSCCNMCGRGSPCALPWLEMERWRSPSRKPHWAGSKPPRFSLPCWFGLKRDQHARKKGCHLMKHLNISTIYVLQTFSRQTHPVLKWAQPEAFEWYLGSYLRFFLKLVAQPMGSDGRQPDVSRKFQVPGFGWCLADVEAEPSNLHGNSVELDSEASA